MACYDVTVTLSLAEGQTLEDAELDSEDDLGEQVYHVEADSAEQAEERALDLFHGTIAVGNLDAVEVDVAVKEADPQPLDRSYLDAKAVDRTIKARWGLDPD